MTRSLSALPAKFCPLWNLTHTLKGHCYSQYSKLAVQELVIAERLEDAKSEELESGLGQVTGRCGSNWVPHERTGIYFPQGHEQVMKDIPNGAATTLSGHATYWLRGVEGVDKAYPETPTDNYLL